VIWGGLKIELACAFDIEMTAGRAYRINLDGKINKINLRGL
jgi:hypothetical protein